LYLDLVVLGHGRTSVDGCFVNTPPGTAHTRRRNGVTLIELIVLIGILAILLGILLPAISYVRTVAADTVCTSRVRDLSMASLMYRLDHGQFPAPCRFPISGDDRAAAVPHQVNTRLINNHGQYLKLAKVLQGTPALLLPHHVQAPWAERTRNGRGPKKTLVPPEPDDYYYTGFIYTADLDLAVRGQQTVPLTGIGELLRPERSASARRGGHGVLWADDLHHNLADGSWQFGHGGSGNGGGEPFSHRDVRSLRGQHRGYTDGSVERVGAWELNLTGSGAELEAGASYRFADTLWWF
jgi:type II secretory pathway pseudopilin PulG